MPFLNCFITLVLLQLFTSELSANPRIPRFDADYVIANKQDVAGRVISVRGYVRFDRVSQRGFLYKSVSDLRKRDYKETIFLELGNENYTSMKIPDGSVVVVTGYLSKELRGPLGVYAGHIIVDQVRVAVAE